MAATETLEGISLTVSDVSGQKVFRVPKAPPRATVGELVADPSLSNEPASQRPERPAAGLPGAAGARRPASERGRKSRRCARNGRQADAAAQHRCGLVQLQKFAYAAPSQSRFGSSFRTARVSKRRVPGVSVDVRELRNVVERLSLWLAALPQRRIRAGLRLRRPSIGNRPPNARVSNMPGAATCRCTETEPASIEPLWDRTRASPISGASASSMTAGDGR